MRLLICLTLVSALCLAAEEPSVGAGAAGAAGADHQEPTAADDEPPEGYYAFVESPNATPPRVRGPPYRQVSSECAGAAGAAGGAAGGAPHVSAGNLCGDLNRGVIPRSPLHRNPGGEPYPFELIRNHTLRFLSRTLPVLRADDTLPRVAHVTSGTYGTYGTSGTHGTYGTRPDALAHDDPDVLQRAEERSGRALAAASSLPVEHRAADADGPGADSDADAGKPRESRKFCDGGGVFCMLYRAINGDSSSSGGVERREDPGPTPHTGPHAPHTHPRYEGPPTPCPARVEYATPVFARNYQGVWRYVVQIPYEGYFTQTVEVTRCMQSRCHYLEGGCLSSPRWVSLLVAELHYPQEYQGTQYQLTKRAGAGGEGGAGRDEAGAGGAGAGGEVKPPHCDGHDEMGCYQVRLYYDWFLVPGSCKCWRPDYFARYVRRRHSTNEL